MEKKLKVILVGNSGVGKTCLVNRFAGDSHTDEHQPTVNVSYYSLKVMNSQNEEVLLQVWDTAGQERFQATTKSFYRGTNVALICFDSSDEESRNSINSWVNAVKDVQEKCIFYLVATKSDILADDSEPIEEFLLNQVNESGTFTKSFLTSAKVGTNVRDVFTSIADEKIQIVEVQTTQRLSTYDDPEINNENQQKKKDCC